MTEQIYQKREPEAGTLRILTWGRKSGLPHIAEVRFAFSNGSYYLLSGGSRTDWAQNAVASATAKIRIGEYVQQVRCETCSEREGVLGLFTKRYGRRIVEDWYRNAADCLKLTPVGPRTYRGSVRGELETQMDLAAWREKNSDYYSAISRAFDSASEEYDFTISHNFINVWIRERSIRELLSIARADDTLLEIGSGTGAEAIRISKKVAAVVAIDISPSMTGLLKRKVQVLGLEGRIIPVQMRASEVAKIWSELPNGKTRVAYSFNGALNCELNIREFPRELSKIMEPQGFFLCSIRNTLCLSEAVVHAAVFQFGRMAPRKKQPVMVSVGGEDVPSFYYSPGEFVEMFKPYFVVEKIIALPGLLPPAYLSNFYFNARKVLGFVERAEQALAGLYPLNRLGDQTLFVFRTRH